MFKLAVAKRDWSFRDLKPSLDHDAGNVTKSHARPAYWLQHGIFLCVSEVVEFQYWVCLFADLSRDYEKIL